MTLKRTSPKTAIDATGALWVASEIPPSMFAKSEKCVECGTILVPMDGKVHWRRGNDWMCARHSEEE